MQKYFVMQAGVKLQCRPTNTCHPKTHFRFLFLLARLTARHIN